MADAAIPLSFRSPQVENPLQLAGQMNSLAAMGQERQLRAQQIQASQLENQQRQQDLNDQQVYKQAWMDAGGDMDKARDIAVQRGVGPKFITQLNNQVLETKTKLAQLGKEQLDALQKRHDNLRGALEAFNQQAQTDQFQALPDDQKTQQWQSWLTTQAQNGNLTKDEYAQYSQAQPGLPNADQLKFYSSQLATGTQLAKEAVEYQNAQSRRATADLNNLRVASQTVPNDPTAYQAWYNALEPRTKARVPSAYSPAAVAQIKQMGMNPEQAAQQPKLEVETEQAIRQNAASILGAAAAQNKDAYARAWYNLDSKVAQQFPHPDQYDPKDPDAFARSVRQVGMTAQQQVTTDQNQDFRQQSLDLRRDIANQTAAFRQAMLDSRNQRNGPQLTPGQRAVEERNISGTEYGTAGRLGLNGQRLQLGTMLKNKKDDKGNPLYNSDGSLTDAGETVTAKLDAVNTSLQQMQFRKAKLYGIAAPDPEDIKGADDGTQITATDGSQWTKSHGVAFYSGPAATQGKTPAAPPPAPTAHKVGDTVSVKGKQYKISAIHSDGTFDADPL